MNALLLEPNDVLFFRDGRPMSGSLSGHGSAWPLPNVINAALHAALHRSGLEGHEHKGVVAGEKADRSRTFGSLVSAGPFPVHQDKWWFPRPADAQKENVVAVTLAPVRTISGFSSLTEQLYPVASCLPPSKDNHPEPWMDIEAWASYLNGGEVQEENFARDSCFGEAEHTFGIAIDPESGSVRDGAFYSASYLRLREGAGLGILAKTQEKQGNGSRADLVHQLFSKDEDPPKILIGGQQRVCSVRAVDKNPLPRGLTDGFTNDDGKFLVKWVLLSPAIWPMIKGHTTKEGRTIHEHEGGWLPNWIAPDSWQVLLRSRNGRRQRKGVRGAVNREGDPIKAVLKAAIVPKAIPVTGWGLAAGHEKDGAKSTHLAVPAGAVYYFEAESKEDAIQLARALNWHGDQPDIGEIVNRRSTLMGEKGFGIGVCGTWSYYDQRK